MSQVGYTPATLDVDTGEHLTQKEDSTNYNDNALAVVDPLEEEDKLSDKEEFNNCNDSEDEVVDLSQRRVTRSSEKAGAKGKGKGTSEGEAKGDKQSKEDKGTQENQKTMENS